MEKKSAQDKTGSPREPEGAPWVIQSWVSLAEQLRCQMEEKHQAREVGLQICRKAIQTCAKSIRSLHRREFKSARRLLNEARSLIESARQELQTRPDLYHAGFLSDAEKEYVEAEVVYAIITGQPFPEPEVLGVGLAAYLNGLGEAASESRRYLLDALRNGELSLAESLFTVMEAIYDELITFDYPDNLTGGLRRTCDALRAVLERTRGDLTMTLTQKELENALSKAKSH